MRRSICAWTGQQKLTAYDVVNGWSREEIRRILFEYGEERYAPLIAAAIERERADKPIETTLELVRVIKGAMPAKALREKQHPAKRSFQAIRIAVNDELGAVREAMEKPSTVSIRAADWRSSPSTAWRTASSSRPCGNWPPAVSVRRSFRYVYAAENPKWSSSPENRLFPVLRSWKRIPEPAVQSSVWQSARIIKATKSIDHWRGISPQEGDLRGRRKSCHGCQREESKAKIL